jgi:hypothetical protein
MIESQHMYICEDIIKPTKYCLKIGWRKGSYRGEIEEVNLLK